MCAINPVHKKRFIIDVYSVDKKLTREEFIERAMTDVLEMELHLNSTTEYRWHLKETDQVAD